MKRWFLLQKRTDSNKSTTGLKTQKVSVPGDFVSRASYSNNKVSFDDDNVSLHTDFTKAETKQEAQDADVSGGEETRETEEGVRVDRRGATTTPWTLLLQFRENATDMETRKVVLTHWIFLDVAGRFGQLRQF